MSREQIIILFDLYEIRKIGMDKYCMEAAYVLHECEL